MRTKISAREAALDALVRIDRDKAYAGLVLGSQLEGLNFSAADRGLYYSLVYGVITHRLALDYVLKKLCRKGIQSLCSEAVNILRLGAVQMLYMDKIPAFAAVNEGVDLARRRLGKAQAGFVNAVLRNISRRKAELFNGLKPGSAEEISVMTSHPSWLVERWLSRWGRDFTWQLCQANNQAGPLSVRVNTRRISRDQYLNLVAETGLEARPSLEGLEGVVFGPGTPFSELPGLEEGLFIVQGEASQLPALALDPLAGERILDMCSAPGGKTSQLAAAASPGRVTALDLYPQRLNKVRANIRRLGLENVDYRAVDARSSGLDQESFDRILLDAPCSGLGVIRNKPDIKWSRQPGDIPQLAMLQRELLTEGARLLKPGGVLVYSTCTLLQEENEDCSAWAEANLALRPLEFSLPNRVAPGGMLTTFPHRDDLEGFFIVKFVKV